MVISSQALEVREGSETISKESRPVRVDGPKRIASFSKDDDIVHPLWKHRDKCNQLVVGSNPTLGANTFFVLLTEIYLVKLAKNQRNSVYAEFFCWSQIYEIVRKQKRFLVRIRLTSKSIFNF